MKKGQTRSLAYTLRDQFASNVIYLAERKFPKRDHPDQARAIADASKKRLKGPSVSRTTLQYILTGKPQEMTAASLETIDSLAYAFELDHPFELLDPSLPLRVAAKDKRNGKKQPTTRPRTPKPN